MDFGMITGYSLWAAHRPGMRGQTGPPRCLRSWTVILAAGLLIAGCGAGQPEAQKLPTPWTFDAEQNVGEPPRGTTVLAGAWAVRGEAGAPSPGQAACQTGTDGTAILTLGEDTYADLFVSAAIKPLFGVRERTGGIFFRLQDENNYYVVSSDALDGSLGVHKYDEGDIRTIAQVPAQIESGQWHELSV